MKKLLFTLLLALVCASANAREVYLIGDATPAEWELGRLDKTKMTETGEGTDVFEWTGVLFKTNSEGFKIITQRDWNPGIHPSTAGLAINTAGSDVTTYSNDNDTKWTVTETAEYTIRVTFGTDNVTVECTKVSDVVTDGVLQVSTADLLEDFAWKLNKGWIDGNSNVALTADINLTSYSPWITIGTDSHKFIGTFDGGGHCIKNMTLDGSKKEQGFFGVIGAGATIKNLIMDASCSIESTGGDNGQCFAAIAGCCNNNGSITFENCGNEANVTGTKQNNAGFLGCNYGSTQLVFNNCYNKGNISGGWENAAFCGWTGGGATFNNCYNIGSVNNGESGKSWARGTKSCNNCYQTVGDDGSITTIPSSEVTSGELCYKLNGDQSSIGWYQNLTGTVDAMPVPFSTGHSQVYANGELGCDGQPIAGGTTTYSNTSTSVIPPHTFDGGNGWCTVCHALNQNYLTVDGEGFYSIGNANDLNWFADMVHQVEWQAKAKLTADIDYTSYKQGFIGKDQAKSFGGTFDGQEHTITIDMVNDGTTNRTALFAFIYGATIKNLIVEGSSSSADKNCIGGLGGRADNTTTIENVIVKTAVSYTGSNGDATAGGILANAEGTLTLKNCAFLGSIKTGTAEGNGGLVGYANSGSNNKYINCLVAPTEYTQNGNSGDFSRNNPNVINCHKVASNDAKLASGELCYTLNAGGDNWYQNLTGTVDATPVPFSSHSKVYANAAYTCDGTPKGTVVYENEDHEAHDPHVNVNGFCSVCNAMVEYIADYMTPVDGYYEISNDKEMRWFAATVNNGNTSAKARLVADIDFTGIWDYTPIGKDDQRYVGTFDGQHHQITNLTLNLSQNDVGIFGVIAEGATIKNFTLASSSSITGNAHVGIVGMIKRKGNTTVTGETHLDCIGNEAAITGSGTNVGGILGVNMMSNSNYAKLYMTNCYSTGKIVGGGESGQLTGWTGWRAVVENCYAIGEMENCDGFARFDSNCTTSNNYCDKNLTWTNHPTQVTTEQIASGELCYKLGEAFGQLIGTDNHPKFNAPVVLYVGAAGYATMYDTTTGYGLNGDATAYVAVLNNTWLDLTEIGKEVPAGTPVILKGTYYNKLAANLPAINVANDLLGTATATEADGTMYILAKVEDAVGFYLATGTIAAGKAYFKSTSGVKAFFFDGDDATGIETLDTNVNANEAIYNLAGQRIQKMQKGINIINGKKVLK